ncbi:MAG: 4-alpha-glucanotransferase [Clostridia bacterium]|nr:4-alpha-glucanotransferase [Clostridia bacterium]
MNYKRSSGVLLHISSLNGPFGIGVMGEQARQFAKKISDMGFTWWQVLPLCPVDNENSPYCSASAFAGNYVFIDPASLEKQGLVTAQEVNENRYPGTVYTADFPFALEKRLALLRKAYSRVGEELKRNIETFACENKWARDYALFMSCKAKQENRVWWLWDKKYAVYENALDNYDELKEEADFWLFVQYEFFTQWTALKQYANSLGVKFIGDMPIYVNRDSVDVWSAPQLFEINTESLLPKEVAGVPPDYFSKDGQLWGNPLYNWDEMRKSGYAWWISRISHALSMYDRVRIDHFRAFASYWAVPADSDTAKNGKWKKGPGMELFSLVKEKIPGADIIAEDLGIFGEDVVQLLEDTAFPGMRVIQFGFDPGSDSTHLPHNYSKNTVAYVGTHDNNTILGWLWEASPAQREFALRYCGFSGNWSEGGWHSASCRAITEAVWKSSAATAIIAFQDMCGFGSDARMNTPGTVGSNWLFRAGDDAIERLDTEYFKQINELYKRK